MGKMALIIGEDKKDHLRIGNSTLNGSMLNDLVRKH